MGELWVSVCEAIKSGLGRLALAQARSGEWEGEVVWSPVILAQYLIVCRIAGKDVAAPFREKCLTYFWKQQTGEGGWGLHPESGAYLFVTTLVYVAMRFLDVPAGDERLAAARALIRKLGTSLCIPTWGKLWLAFCNLYEYAGIHPLSPELWLLPPWLPFHPSRWYCHTRLIYLGMCYLWGNRFCREPDALCIALREELYGAPYASLDFPGARNRLAHRDCLVAPSGALKAAYARSSRAWSGLFFFASVAAVPSKERTLGRLASSSAFRFATRANSACLLASSSWRAASCSSCSRVSNC